MTADRVLEILLAWATSPAVATVATLAVGWALKVGYDVLLGAMRDRGKHDTEIAEVALKKALASPERTDDAVAELALDRARRNQAFLERLAQALEKHKPPLP